MTVFLKHIWSPVLLTKPFRPFTLTHLIALVVLLGLIYLLFTHKEELKDEKKRKGLEMLLMASLGLQQTLLYSWYISSGNFSLSESLPLYSCRIAIILAVFMVYKKSRKIFELVYFWGLVGGIIALITPDTSGFTFPHFMFLQYFWGHGSLILSILYMIIAYDFKPDLASLFRVYKITSVYFVGIFFINKLVGGNYSYLNGKPDTPTLLDVLPPYPFYIPVILCAMFVLFYLAYVPFAWTNNKDNELSKYKPNINLKGMF